MYRISFGLNLEPKQLMSVQSLEFPLGMQQAFWCSSQYDSALWSADTARNYAVGYYSSIFSIRKRVDNKLLPYRLQCSNILIKNLFVFSLLASILIDLHFHRNVFSSFSTTLTEWVDSYFEPFLTWRTDAIRSHLVWSDSESAFVPPYKMALPDPSAEYPCLRLLGCSETSDQTGLV